MSCSYISQGYINSTCDNDYRVLDDFIKLGYNLSFESFMNPHKRYCILKYNNEEFKRREIGLEKEGVEPNILIEEFKQHELILKRHSKINNILNEE